jgi:hypothetical protein
LNWKGVENATKVVKGNRMYNEGVRKARLNDARPELKSLDGMNRRLWDSM